MRLIVNHRQLYSSRLARKLYLLLTLASFLGCSLNLETGEAPQLVCTSDTQCTGMLRCQGGLCVTSVEVCDTIDNDQDGEIDEMVSNACGLCGELPIESCDAIDNDCDGELDEDFPELGLPCVDQESDLSGIYICQGDGVVCAPENMTSSRVEVCDAIDNDLDGEVDEELTLPILDCGADSCRLSSPQRCVDGALFNDCLSPAAEIDESCDGFDDDCDGLIDEGAIDFMVSCGELCGVTSVAVCESGVLLNQCDELLDTALEVCDGLDNDCDELIDEGEDQWRDTMEPCGFGVCQSTRKERCEEGSIITRCSEMPNLPESEDPLSLINRQRVADLCDTEDDDCDGLIDEDSTHDLDRCYSDDVEESFRSIRCQEGERIASECGAFEVLCQETGEPFNIFTCETADADLGDEDAYDLNGDGIDGEVNKSLFVHPTLGDDTLSGTRAEPLQSLSRALELVELSHSLSPDEAPQQILLSVGTYEIDPIIVEHDLTIMGGYVAVAQNGFIDWSRPPMAERIVGAAEKTIVRTLLSGPLFSVNRPSIDLELDALELQVGDGQLNQGEGERSSIGLSLLSCDMTHLREVKIIVGNGTDGRQGDSPPPMVTDPQQYRGVDGGLRSGGEGGEKYRVLS